MKQYKRSPSLNLATLPLVLALVACGSTNDNSDTSIVPETGGDTDVADTGNDTSTNAGSGLSNGFDAPSSSQGVLCDYMDSSYNSSASVLATSTSQWTCSETERVLTANGLPDHLVGTFPNENNPNTISEQTVSVSYTLTPASSETATTLGGPAGAQGYVLNGVKIDASTAGSCDDSGDSCSLIDQSGSWSIEALGQSAFDFGTDDNNAHVQPGGSYHYHGMPEGFITKRGGNASTMTLIAWAADGFPIYARYGYSIADDATSAIKSITGSYTLVSDVPSNRPSTDDYALGTFAQDWEYTEGAGDLDECNGRVGVTPEFPDGIYHYYATDSYPYFQRCVKGAVESTGGPGGPRPTGPQGMF